MSQDADNNDEIPLRRKIANRLAEIREQMAALAIERDALERLTTRELLNIDSGIASPVRPFSHPELPLPRPRQSVPTLSGQVMVLMHRNRDARLTRAGLVELVSALPALAHIQDKRKSAQTVVGRLINEKSIIELESGVLALPIDVEDTSK